MLRIKGLTKRYRTGDLALKGIDIDVPDGQVMALIGPSGAGKSTVIRCINRLVEPTSGSIALNDVDIVKLGSAELRRVRRRMGMIFQEYALVERLSVMENVLTGRLGYVGFWQSWLRRFPQSDIDEAFRLLERVGLDHMADKRADELSGGQRQRVGICRALIQNPELLLVDEPTASLDPKTSRQIMRLITELCGERKLSAIINIHDVMLAQMFAERIVGLRLGEIVYDGPPDKLTPAVLTSIYGEEDWSATIRKVDEQAGEADEDNVVPFRTAAPGSQPIGGNDVIARAPCFAHSRASRTPRLLSAGAGSLLPRGRAEKGSSVSVAATAPRQWKKPPLIRSAWLRWALVVGAVVYLALVFQTTPVNWTRVWEGLPRGAAFLKAFFPPDFVSRWDEIAEGIAESLWMTVVSTVVGIALSIPVGIGAAKNIAPAPVYYFCRAVLAVSRSFQEIILAIFFVKLFGFGPFAGFVTLSFATIGFYGKLLAEDIEDMDAGQAEAVRASGASWLQWINYGVQPQVMPRMIGLGLYRFDINFRESAVIGIVGGGGIGATLNTAFDRYEFDSAAAIIIVIIAIVMLCEYGSGYLRRWVQ